MFQAQFVFWGKDGLLYISSGNAANMVVLPLCVLWVDCRTLW